MVSARDTGADLDRRARDVARRRQALILQAGEFGQRLRSAAGRPRTLLALGGLGYLLGLLSRRPARSGGGALERRVWQVIAWLTALRGL